MPKYRRYVGFIGKRNVHYNEKRALEFVNVVIRKLENIDI